VQFTRRIDEPRRSQPVSTALVPEVAEARDHVRGSHEPTPLVFGDYQCPYTRMAYRSVQALEADCVPFRFVFRHFPLVEMTIFLDGLPYWGSFERAELRRALSPDGEENE
jgi:hypothetical protein